MDNLERDHRALPLLDAMNPLDIVALIDSRPLSAFQVRVLVLIGCLVLMDGFDVQMIGFVAPALLRSWHLTPSALGPIFGAGLFGMLVGSTSLGMLADRVGRRPVVLGATFFVALCVLATAAASSVQQLLILRFLTGLGLGGVLGNAVTLASEYCPTGRRASLLMAISCGFTAGAILGGVLAAALIPHWGWPSVFVVGGLLPLAVGIICVRGLPESLQLLLVHGAARVRIEYWLTRLAPDIMLPQTTSAQIQKEASRKASVIDLFRNGLGVRSLLLWAVSFANLLNLFFLANWLPLLATRMGYSDSWGVFLGTTLQAGGIAGALMLGRFIDRFGFYRVLAPSFLLGAVMIVAIGRPDLPLALKCAVVLLAGAAIVGGQPGINALATSIYPTQLRATGVGWCLGVGRAGSIVGPLAAAQLIAHQLSNEALFTFAAIPAAFASLVLIAMSGVGARHVAAPTTAKPLRYGKPDAR
jgi:AAHS family 4-hydroxybenzoate transporter-like MFS transporter